MSMSAAASRSGAEVPLYETARNRVVTIIQGDAWHRTRMALFDGILADPILSPTAKNIAWVLLSLVNDGYSNGSPRSGEAGEAWPSIDTISVRVAVDERTARRAVRQLVEGGWFFESRGGGRGQSNRWTPNVERTETPAKTPPFAAVDENEKGGKNAPKGGQKCSETPAKMPPNFYNKTHIKTSSSAPVENSATQGARRHTSQRPQRHYGSDPETRRTAILDALGDDLKEQPRGGQTSKSKVIVNAVIACAERRSRGFDIWGQPVDDHLYATSQTPTAPEDGGPACSPGEPAELPFSTPSLPLPLDGKKGAKTATVEVLPPETAARRSSPHGRLFEAGAAMDDHLRNGGHDGGDLSAYEIVTGRRANGRS